ncbi:MAG: ATP-binding protein [Vicinamibacteria bacterium]|nr:ATP-binding protein [Vicinamibacteria bacterium]
MNRDSSARRRRTHAAPDAAFVRRFRMPSRREAVAPSVDRILETILPAGLSDDQRDDLAVALSEALSNAAVHGNRLRTDAVVRVVIRVEPGHCAVIEIADEGPGFDVAHVHDPTDPDRLLATGGRGVFMMKRLVDRLEYNPSGNKVRLTIERRV